ncbi:MAG: polysaccharide ABC transporter ATP-binding protein [Planctomycetota bacterium]|nr:polysaccharide ABC transporter ATP-binding protein [Planctomycetota bacterium]
MNDVVISVRGLGKEYRIGEAGSRFRYKSFRDTIANTFSAPFHKREQTNGDIATDNTFWALKDVSFDVHRGEVIGIIGRNGAGKSTLLKILSRITEPTEGEIEIVGRVGSLLEVGTGFHPELTGRENIFLNGAILGMRHAEIAKKFDEIVAFAETEKFLDTPVKYYSSGMYTRLAFAVAAHLEPEILVVDEVLAVGDAEFQKKCLGKMNEVASQGRTVLFVSHHMTVVRELCKNAVCLANGQVQDIGPVREVVDKYLASTLSAGTQVYDNGRCAVGLVEILDAEGNAVATVDAGAAWSIRIHYELREPMVTGASIRLTSSRGPIVIDAHEFIGGGDMRQTGRYITTYDMSGAALAPGMYFVSVFLMVHHGAVNLLANTCATMTVVGALRGYQGSIRPFDIDGFIYLQPKIETKSVSGNAGSLLR